MKITLITPRVAIDLNQIKKSIDKAMEAGLTKMQKDFLKTTRTWRHTVKFDIYKPSVNGSGNLQGAVGTNDNRYRYIARGTRVRYATMTPDFSPKTKVNIINSFRGKGGLLYYNRRRPRPGIKARNFEKVISAKHKDALERLLANAFGR